MAIVAMPQLGESVTEGTILKWFKQPGDAVALDDSLCEIETEKVTAELPSPFEGTMGRLLVAEGETVAIDTPLCEVQESRPSLAAGASNAVPMPGSPPPLPPQRERGPGGEGPTRTVPDDDDDDLGLPPGPQGWTGGPMAIPPDESRSEEPSFPGRTGAAPAGPKPVTPSPPLPRSRERQNPYPGGEGDMSGFISPVVARLAAERNIDPRTIVGTGAGGRVTKRDIEEPRPSVSTQESRLSPAVGSSPSPPLRPQRERGQGGEGYTVVTLSPTRRTIAEHLTRSNLEAPQAWTMVEADITKLVRRREQDRGALEQMGVKLTLLPYFAQAVCAALRDVPALNARWEGPELRRYSALNLGVAVAAEHGLVVPVIHDAQELSIEGFAARISDLAERARTRKLRIEDIQNGTFTVNNTGAFGSIASKPIVNHPEVGIVTMERAVQRAVVLDDAIAIRWMVNVCLSFDHRALDGLEAGRFLATLKGALEAIA